MGDDTYHNNISDAVVQPCSQEEKKFLQSLSEQALKANEELTKIIEEKYDMLQSLEAALEALYVSTLSTPTTVSNTQTTIAHEVEVTTFSGSSLTTESTTLMPSTTMPTTTINIMTTSTFPIETVAESFEPIDTVDPPENAR